MYNFVKLRDEERRVVFENTASKLKMNLAIIEKDFWVCFIVDYLFNKCKYKDSFAFKGGTCLSKVYGLIDRFSEDIDLILDWRILGYSKDEPWEERSNSKQDIFNKEAIKKQNKFLKSELLPLIKRDIKEVLRKEIGITEDKDEEGVINIDYPKTLKENSILQEIRLEIGALAAWTPTINAEIKPYIADSYPDLLKKSKVKLLATTDVRTFWEKATILHQEANRPKESKLPRRYSRHYYDLYCMANKGVLEKALKENELLVKVADFKNKFYRRLWADYDNARIGTLKLIPSSHFMEDLKKDYANMKEMIYGDYPEFDVLINGISEIEKTINNRKKWGKR